MDIEAPLRRNLIDRLGTSFELHEEWPLVGQNGRKVRADVFAVSKSDDFSDICFAFEVKTASNRNFQKWTDVFLQAHYYVGAVDKKDRVVRASFVFPGPPYLANGPTNMTSEYWRDEQALELTGALHMASKLNVGSASIGTRKPYIGLSLNIGPKVIWSEVYGWNVTGLNAILSPKRRKLVGCKE